MDIYFKKEIKYRFAGRELIFDVGNTLFSTYDIDRGTDMLIRTIDFDNPQKVLDIGCGYGPLGIMLASKYPTSEVIMIDRDLLAVKYTKSNIQKNQIDNATAFGSIGIEQVEDQQFDLIVSNIPAKIGDEAITKEFILKPYQLLVDGGEMWVVVVTALNRLIPKIGRKYELNVKEVKKRKGYTVYRIRKPMTVKL